MSEFYSYPTGLKKLRACMGCHILKTENQVYFFYDLFSLSKKGVKIVVSKTGIKVRPFIKLLQILRE
jgi:hypothetical protein